ncbi:MAG: hypothetical protein JWN64_125 [Parcubacteria group bacterium]|nr:hypothetical protein [Parcubacteria group bacterium]
MGDILEFPEVPDRWPSSRPGLRKPNGPWRAIDLKGKPPEGHQSPSYGPRGKVLIATEQVWIEGHTQRVYVVVELINIRDTFYPHDVIFASYKDMSKRRRLAETTFRLSMKIWDVFEVERKPLVESVCVGAKHDPTSPWKGVPQASVYALNFFGLDNEGYRID